MCIEVYMLHDKSHKAKNLRTVPENIKAAWTKKSHNLKQERSWVYSISLGMKSKQYQKSFFGKLFMCSHF